MVGREREADRDCGTGYGQHGLVGNVELRPKSSRKMSTAFLTPSDGSGIGLLLLMVAAVALIGDWATGHFGILLDERFGNLGDCWS